MRERLTLLRPEEPTVKDVHGSGDEVSLVYLGAIAAASPGALLAAQGARLPEVRRERGVELVRDGIDLLRGRRPAARLGDEGRKEVADTSAGLQDPDLATEALEERRHEARHARRR